MTVKICPHCNSRYAYTEHSGDFVHDCSSSANNTLRKEDVLVLGDWKDYTGNGVQNNALLQGVGNKLQFTRAGVDGDDFDGLTARGNNVSNHRERIKLTYIGAP